MARADSKIAGWKSNVGHKTLREDAGNARTIKKKEEDGEQEEGSSLRYG